MLGPQEHPVSKPLGGTRWVLRANEVKAAHRWWGCEMCSGFGRPSAVTITTGLSDSSPRNVSKELEKALTQVRVHACS